MRTRQEISKHNTIAYNMLHWTIDDWTMHIRMYVHIHSTYNTYDTQIVELVETRTLYIFHICVCRYVHTLCTYLHRYVCNVCNVLLDIL